MAAFNGTYFRIQNSSNRGAEHPIPSGQGAVGFAPLATSGTAQTVQRDGGPWSAPADGYVLCEADGPVRVAAGETAFAGSAPVGVYVPAGRTMPVSVVAGQSLSVIDAES